MSTLLRAALGGALLTLATACGGEMDASWDGTDGELEARDSELVDEFASADALEETDVIDKATFNDNSTYNGFNVTCTAEQKRLINAAEARAREILTIARPATGEARVNRNTTKGQVFRIYFAPNGSATPPRPGAAFDEVDTAAFSVVQKLIKVSQALATAVHTCHGPNESHALLDPGGYMTCDQTRANAATSPVGGADNPIRWCNAGLSRGVNERAITLLHELTHQDRTADATGRRVTDTNDDGRLYNAHNYGSWLNNNLP